MLGMKNVGQMNVCTEGVLSEDVFWKGEYLDLAVGPTTPCKDNQMVSGSLWLSRLLTQDTLC